MNAGRIILLGIALLAGGGVFYLMATGQEAPEVITQVVPAQTEIETVRVLIADKEFARGERLNPASTKWVRWPKQGLPAFLITEDNKSFYEELPNSLARSEIVAGEPITEAKVIRPGNRGMMSALLTAGMRAVTMDVSSRQAAAGFILPGDRVDIYSTYEDRRTSSLESKVMYSNVRVLAVDQSADQNIEGAMIGRTVTLELAPSQLPAFLTAREQGTLNLVLRSVFMPENGEELLQEAEPAEVVVVRYGQS